MEPELTRQERMLAQDIPAWVVWYEDRFGFGEDRDSFPVALCLSEQDVNDELARRDRPLPISGGDGYEASGPRSLLEWVEMVIVSRELAREVLARAGEVGHGTFPIPV